MDNMRLVLLLLFTALLTSLTTSNVTDATGLQLGKDSGSLAKVKIEQIVQSDAEVLIQVYNLSDHVFPVYDYVEVPRCQFELHNSKGEKCDWTGKGRAYFGDFITAVSGVFRQLEPGQHYEWKVDLKEMFKIEPGEYKLSFKMDLMDLKKDSGTYEVKQRVKIQVTKFLVK